MTKHNHSIYDKDVNSILSLKPGEYHTLRVDELDCIRRALCCRLRNASFEKGVFYRHIKVSKDIAYFFKTNSSIVLNEA